MVNRGQSVLLVLLLLLPLSNLKAEKVETIEDPLQDKLIALEHNVSKSGVRQVEFTEERFFSFRKKPIELEGILRLWSGVGVSISYPKKKTLLIADDLGVLVRKFRNNGSFRQKSMNVERLDTIYLLKAAFEFDRTGLERLFHLEWEENDDQWSIIMTPRREDEKKIKEVMMSGCELEIKRIDLVFVGEKKIVIHPKEEQLKEAFSQEEQSKYFRSPMDEKG